MIEPPNPPGDSERIETTMPKPKLTAAVLAGSLLAGGAAGTLLFTPISALAQESTDTPRSPVGWIADALKKLVDDGTISQAQSDAVAQALQDAKPAHGPRGGGGGRMSLDAAAEALNMGGTELRDELAAGKTIAEVAAEQGVAVQTVIDALVADFKAHLAEHVANGTMTQEEADAKAADAVQRFTDLVNNDFPFRGHGGHGGPGRMGPPPADAPAATPSA